MAKSSTIIIGGLSGTGSTTASKQLSEQLGLEYVYAGGIFRELADEAGETIVEFNETLKSHPEQERAIDDTLIERAKAGDVIIESRVLGWILPKEVPAFRVWLTCDISERVHRILLREETTRDKVDLREQLEKQRYQDLYKVDQSDLSSMDLVVDTTKIPAGTATEQIIKAHRKR